MGRSAGSSAGLSPEGALKCFGDLPIDKWRLTANEQSQRGEGDAPSSFTRGKDAVTKQ